MAEKLGYGVGMSGVENVHLRRSTRSNDKEHEGEEEDTSTSIPVGAVE